MRQPANEARGWHYSIVKARGKARAGEERFTFYAHTHYLYNGAADANVLSGTCTQTEGFTNRCLAPLRLCLTNKEAV